MVWFWVWAVAAFLAVVLGWGDDAFYSALVIATIFGVRHDILKAIRERQ